MTPLVVFVVPYVLLASVFSYLVRGLGFGEVCSAYALLPILLLLAADYGLEKLNGYLAERVAPLKERIPLTVYMALLNAMMYLSVYTAGAFWTYRLSGKYFLVPLLFLVGLVSGGMVVRRYWREEE